MRGREDCVDYMVVVVDQFYWLQGDYRELHTLGSGS